MIVLEIVLVIFAVIIFIAAVSGASQTATNTDGDSGKVQSGQRVRNMAAAGIFYPDKKEGLETALDKYLAEVKKDQGLKKSRLLIVPHAGLEYSGNVAANAYKQIEGEQIKSVVIIGSSHVKGFTHAGIISEGVWETPEGPVEVDTALAEKIIDPKENILNDPTVHEKEHSLEMQIIWIKKLLPEAKIVPIMISTPTDELIYALAFRIAQNFDENTLLVISSDLSHYPDYDTAKNIDEQTIKAMLTGNKTEFEKRFAEIRTEFAGVQTPACGFEAIRVGLKAAELLNFDKPELLKYQNSGDVTNDKNRVVGYAAIRAKSEKIKLTVPHLDDQAQAEAAEIARKSLEATVNGQEILTEQIKNRVLLEPLGAFVTLRKNGELRGCIGEFDPSKPLYKVIEEKTRDAAKNDPRFNPVTNDELKDIKIEISVMTPRIRLTDWKNIDLGQDGVVITAGNRSGTFLPQVAKETGWKLEEYLEQLCSQKAGLDKNCYLDPKTQFFTFRAQVFE